MELLLGIFFPSFVLGLSGALVPGPLLTLTISDTVRRGFWTGPLLIVGHALLELVVVILLFFGLGAFLQRTGIFALVAIVGAGFLFWMAYGMLRGLKNASLTMTAAGTSNRNPVLAGSLVSASNPYFLLWWGTVGLGYIAIAERFGVTGVCIFYLGHILADFAWYSLVALGISMGRRFISDAVYRGIICFCAIFLIAFGAYFGFVGMKNTI